ncbi:MAG: hypothetical protein U0930_13060 [Pirellulales bacterium]
MDESASPSAKFDQFRSWIRKNELQSARHRRDAFDTDLQVRELVICYYAAQQLINAGIEDGEQLKKPIEREFKSDVQRFRKLRVRWQKLGSLLLDGDQQVFSQRLEELAKLWNVSSDAHSSMLKEMHNQSFLLTASSGLTPSIVTGQFGNLSSKSSQD